MFSCKFSEIFKNTFFTEHLQKNASNVRKFLRINWYFSHPDTHEWF